MALWQRSFWGGWRSFDHWITTTKLPPTLAAVSVEVQDRTGKLLRAYPVADGIWRLDVASDQVDPTYLAMLLRYEDKRFYSHSGVDLRAMLRAGTQAVWRGEVVSGGSTLTMQVARLLENGVSEDALSTIHSPIGLDIGSSSPAEIAVAIMGEIIAELRTGSA